MRQLLLLLLVLIGTQGKAADSTPNSLLADVEKGQERQSTLSPNTPINAAAIELFNNDYLNNVRDTLKSRWFFRKVAGVFESSGNTFVYISAGAPAVAAAVRPFSEDAYSVITGIGLVSLGIHVAFIGIAKCSARETAEKEKQLNDLAAQLGFKIVPLTPTITDDAEQKTG